MKCEKVTIEQFMDCWFNDDYEKISVQDFELIYSEYIDLAGLYQTKAFELTAYINYLKNRIHVLGIVVFSQKMYFEVFRKPYIEGLELIKEKFGLSYNWDCNEQSLFSFLRKLENTIRTKKIELNRKEHEIEKLKQEKKEGNVSKVQSRHEFIRMLNSLSKNGYKIERDKTTVEELALIIKMVTEERDKYETEQKMKTR